MQNARYPSLRNIISAVLRPRYVGPLASQAKRVYARLQSADLQSRLHDLLRRTSEEMRSNDERPVFVLSAGWRSGSTLLQRMIMKHNTDILLWGEPYPYCNIHDSLVNQFRAFNSKWPPDGYLISRINLTDPSNTWIANFYPDVDDLLKAHRQFYSTLFAEPARKAGWKGWGMKEVRLTIDHAAYLRVLYPKCKIVLLYRNPHDAYLSFRRWNIAIARTWPDSFISTPYAFGRCWAEMTRGYLEGHERVGALLVRYEDLDDEATAERLRAYLGWPVPRASEMRSIRDPEYVRSRRQAQSETLPTVQRFLLNLATRKVLRDAGYLNKSSRS